ncbi:DUF58 domain-containing protein [Neptunitalea lumnitzerae]|uniref:DUF58 domain-containing protein n=1 Tax=Neptunitalea lumnitzerae TaxID=2965509 RepID=A0ABQ5MGM7_9FLAO|nr:DUF58 domain-containing protein [Neptunitalea sp. Y10]GLB48574.1 hypothetical protein Y10_09420 [Neptunitalea sp. Y10]
MDIQKELQNVQLFKNLDLLTNQAVEGFISGMHKSPFHGFSSEFAEHAIYNQGESTKHIDWKLYAKTDKLYTKRYEEETNLRCHIIIDNSSSMHYPIIRNNTFENLNKIGFSVLASAALMNLLKRQRDAIGLSVYSDEYEFYAPEKGSERHHQMLLHYLSNMTVKQQQDKTTKTYTYLHQIAEKIHRRSMIILFTDMLQTETDNEALFEALKHLKYNKHEVILFHTIDTATEQEFDFTDKPKRFTDIETGDFIDLYAENVRDVYKQQMEAYIKEIKLQCARYRIKYVDANIKNDINKVLFTYLIERHIFA